MDIIDTDHNGKINYSEFVASSLENSYIFKQENLINVFKMLDSDNNGTVSPAELKEALTRTRVIILYRSKHRNEK
jgi:Ca2+-binding EF-hand superfamily protein